jgi:hypothetical protein
MEAKTMTKKEVEVEEIVRPKVSTPQRASKINTIIVSFIVTVIFAYIGYDFFIAKPKIHNKIAIVNTKFDSLKTHLALKLPEIEKAIQTQQQQVKTLQDLSAAYLKK